MLESNLINRKRYWIIYDETGDSYAYVYYLSHGDKIGGIIKYFFKKNARYISKFDNKYEAKMVAESLSKIIGRNLFVKKCYEERKIEITEDYRFVPDDSILSGEIYYIFK